MIILLIFQNTNITEQIAKISKNEARDIITRKQKDAGEQLKDRVNKNREKSQNNRFKVVNCTRSLEESRETMKEVTIVDVEKEHPVCSSLTNPSVASSSTQGSNFTAGYEDIVDDPWVYDLYIADDNSDAILHYADNIDLNDLRLVLLEEKLYSYNIYI